MGNKRNENFLSYIMLFMISNDPCPLKGFFKRSLNQKHRVEKKRSSLDPPLGVRGQKASPIAQLVRALH